MRHTLSKSPSARSATEMTPEQQEAAEEARRMRAKNRKAKRQMELVDRKRNQALEERRCKQKARKRRRKGKGRKCCDSPSTDSQAPKPASHISWQDAKAEFKTVMPPRDEEPDASRHMGHSFREDDGRFGSMPMYDDYDGHHDYED